MQLRDYLKANKPSKVKKGHFTTAYLYQEQGKVLLESRCPVKECMALRWFPDSRLFPEVSFSELEDTETFEMPLYTTGRSVKKLICKEDYEGIYLPLRKVSNVKDREDFINQLKEASVAEDLIEVLVEAYEACMNYEYNPGFEISPRNVAATADGKLILLDCFYIKSQIRRSKR